LIISHGAKLGFAPVLLSPIKKKFYIFSLHLKLFDGEIKKKLFEVPELKLVPNLLVN
jgi:hypothetical protein